MCVTELPRDTMTSVTVIQDDAHFHTELASAGTKLVAVDFTASWCGPCKRISPFFDELSSKYPSALFLKVDVDQCQETAAAYGVNAMPTFMMFRNKVKIDKMQGADNKALEDMIKKHYGDEEWEGEELFSTMPGPMLPTEAPTQTLNLDSHGFLGARSRRSTLAAAAAPTGHSDDSPTHTAAPPSGVSLMCFCGLLGFTSSLSFIVFKVKGNKHTHTSYSF